MIVREKVNYLFTVDGIGARRHSATVFYRPRWSAQRAKLVELYSRNSFGAASTRRGVAGIPCHKGNRNRHGASGRRRGVVVQFKAGRQIGLSGRSGIELKLSRTTCYRGNIIQPRHLATHPANGAGAGQGGNLPEALMPLVTLDGATSGTAAPMV